MRKTLYSATSQGGQCRKKLFLGVVRMQGSQGRKASLQREKTGKKKKKIGGGGGRVPIFKGTYPAELRGGKKEKA